LGWRLSLAFFFMDRPLSVAENNATPDWQGLNRQLQIKTCGMPKTACGFSITPHLTVDQGTIQRAFEKTL